MLKRSNIVINLGIKVIRLFKVIKLDDNIKFNSIVPLNIVKLLLSKMDNVAFIPFRVYLNTHNYR